MIIGIDLGTTNSCVAIFKNGKPEIIPNALGHNLTPSAVSIDDSGTLLVGLAARERDATHPKDTALNFKRYMGTSRQINLGNKTYSPEDLSAMVLRSLKESAESYLGEKVTEAVITVPAYFNDKQRKATKRAGEIAGLKVERLINEPTAAALAYGIHTLEKDAQYLVFDLGGGTFDVSIVEIFDGIIEVRASTGNNYLGGEDFNDAIINYAKKKLEDKLGNDLNNDTKLLRIIRQAAEKTRRQLSSSDSATLEFVYNNEQYTIEISSQNFEEISAPLVDKLKEPIIRALRDSKINLKEIDEIILIGGATRMPIIRRAITRMFSRFPNHVINPDEAVAMGAAVQAGLKARNEDLKEVVVTDVCPYTLGVNVSDNDGRGNIISGLFAPIIERNTIVPTSREESFFTMHDMQKEVVFSIYQGEARLVVDNIKLGEITIPVPPKKAGEVRVNCRFTYDIDGLLEVDVIVPETGKKQNLVVVDDNGPKGDDLEKRRLALAALKVHPRDTEQNVALMARANRCYENMLGTERQIIASAIKEFESALNTQEQKIITQIATDLSKLLDEFEGETFL